MTVLFSSLSFACAEKNEYEKYVSVLRRDIYEGYYDDIKLTAEYGFKETPFINDGIARERIYGYTVFLPVIPDEIKRSVSITAGEEKLSANFTTDEVSGEYKAFIETRDIHLSEFTATITCGSNVKETKFLSVIPENAISYVDALDTLKHDQKTLLSAFSENGVFNAELYLKIFVKKGKPFWYVGIAYGSDRLKALVIDGINAEILAVREIA